MTLKGKKNHYNVKLLRGYGVSISLKENKIILKNGRHDITGKQESEEWFVNNMPYEKIILSGKVTYLLKHYLYFLKIIEMSYYNLTVFIELDR